MKRYVVLIVDDDPGIRLTFSDQLKEEGYSVLTAATYDEAQRLLEENSFDLILADIPPGGKTGIDLLREVRRRGGLTPVILITGTPQVETAAAAVRHGAYDYIPKPITRATLQRIARMAITFSCLEKEKEAYRLKMDAVFKSLRDGLVTLDNNLRIIQINPAAGDLTGWGRGAIGMRMDTPAAGCSQEWLSAVTKVLVAGAPSITGRFKHLTASQKGNVFSMTISPLQEASGTQSGAICLIHDETRIDSLERGRGAPRQLYHLIGHSPKMQEVLELVENLAPTDTAVLITGESGSGKEIVAEAIHYLGKRHGKPLVKVNCAALVDSLLESELFGHVRGAFTGATRDKIGRFQKADGGTLFLDEIGDISPAMQARLLRVLQEKEFEPVGSSSTIRVDVRVIAATHRDLEARVARGEFREDLYYRLRVVTVETPPLRLRREDILPLAETFIGRFRLTFDKEIFALSPEVVSCFLAYDWPGNVRELQHVIERAFVLCHDRTIELKHLPTELCQAKTRRLEGLSEKERLMEALQQSAGNKTQASLLLGVTRKTFYRLLHKHSLI